MKTTEEQIRDLIAQIEKQEGNIHVLQAKLAKLVRQSVAKKETTNESTQGGSQLLQE